MGPVIWMMSMGLIMVVMTQFIHYFDEQMLKPNFFVFIPEVVAAKHSLDAQLMNHPSSCDPLHLIRVVNIPWTATKSSIVDLFTDIRILNGKNGVHFIIDSESKHNDAFIQLTSNNDYRLAMNCQGFRMDYTTVDSKYLCRPHKLTFTEPKSILFCSRLGRHRWFLGID